MIFIELIFAIFLLPPASIKLLKGEVTPATRRWRTRPIRTHRLCSASFSRPVMEIKIVLPENCSQHDIVCIENQSFSISFISNDCISLQASCQIFADRSAPFGQPISHSLGHAIHIYLISLTYHTSLLPHLFISFRDIII
jgi:hypothetical protein